MLALPVVRALRVARFRLLLAVVVLAAVLVSHIGNLVGAWNGYEHGADFGTLMSGARYIWEGFGYAPMKVGAPEQFLTGAHSEPYPPTFFLLVWPWAFMPTALSVASWIAVEEAALALTLLLVWRGIGRPSLAEGAFAVALVLVFLPIRENLFEGQLGVLVTLGVCAAMLALQRGRPVLGGIPLGLAIAIKVTPAFLLPYFLWRRGWKLVASALATTGVVALGTLAVGWLPRWPEYLAELGPLNRGTAFIGNQSLNGVLLRAWNPAYSGLPIPPLPGWLTLAWYAANLALVGAVLLVVSRFDLPQPLRGWTELAVVLLALPLIQPFAWFHHHAAAIVAILVGLRLVRQRFLGAWPALGLAVAYAVTTFVAYPVHRAARSIGGELLPQQPWLRFGTSVMVIAVLLAVLCLAFARRHGGVPARTQA